MQTLIKWPGGKTSEFEIIKNFIPKYERYVEPFFGGGAIFFNMPPQKAVINDISTNLMQFYTFIKTKNEKFKDCLYTLDDEWTSLKSLAQEESTVLRSKFLQFRSDETIKNSIEEDIARCCDRVAQSIAETSKVVVNSSSLKKELSRMVRDKFFRTRKNEQRSNRPLSEEDIKENIVTGFTSGYYMYLRNVLNQTECRGSLLFSDEYKTAIFYFVREFCYGAMFRYNRAGEFNIPYGGIAYNGKDFRKKIDMVFSKETQEYFENTEIFCCDFEEVLNRVQKGDFVFLDPPYDTDFSDYENRMFREDDQRRLAACLHKIKAKFLLIIKNTPLISELYQNNGYKVYAFDNQYSYCVKGRNDRNAVHLIVTNYDQDKTS